MADEDGGTPSDRPDDELSGEPVGELSDVVAAEDTREDCQEVTNGGCDVRVAREGHDRGRLAGECGHVLVSHQPVVQPKAEPETVDRGEPGTLAKGLGAGLDLSLDTTLAKGLDRSLARSFAPILAKTLAKNEGEGELEALVAC
jgi:hypothetical protein